MPVRVHKRIISDMDSAYFPDKLIMPYIETVHDKYGSGGIPRVYTRLPLLPSGMIFTVRA